MVSIGQLSEYAKSGPPTAVKGIINEYKANCKACTILRNGKMDLWD